MAGEFYASAGLVLLGVEDRGLGVDRLAQRLARLEMGHALLGDLHAFTGARIASDARRAPVDREAAEAADLDPMAAHQRVAHGVEDGLDGVFGVAVRELRKAGCEFFDEIGAGHGKKCRRKKRTGWRPRRPCPGTRITCPSCPAWR